MEFGGLVEEGVWGMVGEGMGYEGGEGGEKGVLMGIEGEGGVWGKGF